MDDYWQLKTTTGNQMGQYITKEVLQKLEKVTVTTQASWKQQEQHRT